MVITFLVGNGFDISCDIDTSYNGFYKWYCAKDDKVSEHITDFRENILKDLEKTPEERTWADFELGLGQYTENFSMSTIDLFWDCYEDALLNLQEYVEMQEKLLQATISSTQTKSFIDGILNFHEELPPVDREAIGKLLPGQAKQNVVYRFISFNYTSILDNLVKTCAKDKISRWSPGGGAYTASVNPKVLHVHGKLNSMALIGVDNADQIKNKELLDDYRMQQHFIKRAASTALGQTEQDEAKKYIETSNIVCLFGLSIGKTDAHWWETVMEWLLKSRENRLIVFWHTGGKVTGKLFSRLLREQETIRSKIMEYADLGAEQIEVVEKQICVIFDTKRVFKIEFEKASKELLAIAQ